MGDYTYKVSLRLRHPTTASAEFTAELGVQPSRSWEAGAPRTTPKGTPLSGVNKETYWIANYVEGASANADLAAAVGGVLDKLAKHQAFFDALSASGGRAEFFIGWFFDGNSGDVFSWKLLGRLAQLKIDLSLDVYPD